MGVLGVWEFSHERGTPVGFRGDLNEGSRLEIGELYQTPNTPDSVALGPNLTPKRSWAGPTVGPYGRTYVWPYGRT
jgi:hypothetical protein